MTQMRTVAIRSLTAVHEPWDATVSRPVMDDPDGPGARLRLTNRFLERDGVPYIPVSGEMHYSRVPRSEWAERLRLMKSGGITAVAFYIFWIHHQEDQGVMRFEGNLDLRSFVELCATEGLEVVLRIGPWCHGEARNGGFPDWVQASRVRHRTDDPAYLELVRPWFAAIAHQLAGLFGTDGPIIAIQVENELYDQPGHISTLKRMAQDAGMAAPIWTATGWGGAELPEADVMPLYGGYADGFWVDHDAPWDVTFREHFFFSHVWDDPGIGADLRAHPGIGAGSISERQPRTPSELYPAATCELGGGMAKAYHRRPRLSATDIAAVAHNKIGNGSAWQGYYMYTGGTNPAGRVGMQESHATTYPNDLARFDYDFAAPIGSTGRLHHSHAALRRQHAFLRAFGANLATMPSTLPQPMPTGIDDRETLRWALRSDGASGFVFVGWQQPFVDLPDYADASFQIVLDDGVSVELPDRPMTIPAGTLAHWPLNLRVGDILIEWATASPLTVIDGEVPTLVLSAERGIDVRLAFGPGISVVDNPAARVADGITVIDADEPAVVRVESGGGRLDVVVIPSALTDELWVLDGASGRSVVLSKDPVWAVRDRLAGRCDDDAPDVRRYSVQDRRFVPVEIERPYAGRPSAPVPFEHRPAPRETPPSYGTFEGRASAPSESDFEAFAESFELDLPRWALEEGELAVSWAGDVIRLLIDGVPVADQYWSGVNWLIDLGSLSVPEQARVEIQLMPMHPDAAIGLPSDAEARRRDGTAALHALDAISVSRRGRWQERELS